jgi:hypothetical protein
MESKENFKKERETHNDQRYSEQELKNLFTFLKRQLFLNQVDDEIEFDFLGPNNITILCLFLRKMYKKKTITKLTYENFKDLRSLKIEKRREEKNKKIYKEVLKSCEKEFKVLFNNLKKQYKDAFPKIFRSRRCSFYFWLLKKTILANSEMKDIVMDIFCGKSKIFKGPIERFQNWSSYKNTEPKAITNISSSIKYLIRNDSDCKQKFISLMNNENNNGLISSFHNDIEKKLNIKFKYSLNHLKIFNYSFKKFVKFLKEKIDSSKYKTPWTIKTIKEAIDSNIYELENDPRDRLKREFERIKKRHYSFRKP